MDIDDQIVESLAETICEEIGDIGLADIIGSAINLYHPIEKFDMAWQYIATVGFHNQKIVLAVHNTDIHIDADISNPESFDLIFSKIRELVRKYK